MGNGKKNKSRVKKNKEKAAEMLPTEMLENLLKYVDTPSLYKCRLVNRQWCAVSSGILCQRPETEIEFQFSTDKGFITCTIKSEVKTGGNSMGSITILNHKKSEKKTLKDFMECFTASTNCPWSRLSIICNSYDFTKTFFDHEDWPKFLSDYHISRVKSLKLEFHGFCYKSQYSIVKLTQKVRNLLLTNFPHLEEFELFLSHGPAQSEIELFPPTEKNNATPTPFQLPNLKVIRFQNFIFSNNPEISKRLLNAAVNLKEVHVYSTHLPYYHMPETFEFLHSVGKLHLLQEAKIQLNGSFPSNYKPSTNSPFIFKLKKLELSTFNPNISSNPKVWEEATKFVQNLFETSKDSLRKLRMEPIGFLRSLQFPRLKNLVELKLERNSSPDPFLPTRVRNLTVFPAGVRNSDIFPAVRHLDLEFIHDWNVRYPGEDFIPRLPSVKTLSMVNRGVMQNSIRVLALLCPNLKDFQINPDMRGYFAALDFLQVGRAIFSKMRQLESLELDLDMTATKNRPATLDSCLTGISLENCQRLYEMMEAKKTLDKWGSGGSIPESELTAEREHSSILDMKNLRKLTVNYSSKNKSLKRKEFLKMMTWISQEYALKLMPQLEINGVKS